MDFRSRLRARVSKSGLVGCSMVRLGGEGECPLECFAEGYVGLAHNASNLLNLTVGYEPPCERATMDMIESSYLEDNPEQDEDIAQSQCEDLYEFYSGIEEGDFVLSPSGGGEFAIGRVTSDYYFVDEYDEEDRDKLIHRRDVAWLDKNISRERLSVELYVTTQLYEQAVADITEHHDEIRDLVARQPIRKSYALDNRFEDFLVENWDSSEFGRDYEIYKEDGEVVGQQHSVVGGRKIDILAVSKDGSELLVIEVQKDRTPEEAVGQLQKYMEFMRSQPEAKGKEVRGCIIAPEDGKRFRSALKATSNIDFCRYNISFKLRKIP